MKCSVIAILFEEEMTRVLAIKRRDVPVWVLPGGGVEENETPEKAVIREVFEETSLRVSIKRKIGLYAPINKLTSFTHVFECTIENGQLQIGRETKDIGFFPFKSLPPSFFPIHEDMLNDALMKKPEVMNKKLSQVTYWNVIKYFIQHPILVIRFALSQAGFPINS